MHARLDLTRPLLILVFVLRGGGHSFRSETLFEHKPFLLAIVSCRRVSPSSFTHTKFAPSHTEPRRIL